MGGLPPICHRNSEKLPKNVKRGLNSGEFLLSALFFGIL